MGQSSERPCRFASALSEGSDWREAIDRVCREALETLGGTPDLAMLFFSQDHVPAAEELAHAACERLGTSSLLGCSGESIVGTGREVECSSAISLWLAILPGTRVISCHLSFAATPDGGSFLGWPDELAAEWPATSSLLVLGEPFSFPADYLLQRVNEDHPGVPVVGGMASGGSSPGDCRVILGTGSHEQGAVVALLDGPHRFQSVVSQGCRPIGKHFVVTRAERNVIYELGGRPALERLQQVFRELPNREQALLQQGLHVGRVVSEYQETFDQGDFLVRNVAGVDPRSGAIAIGDYVRVGQTVQFHVRDQASADEELRQLLTRVRTTHPHAAGALLFTCNGRGTRLFDRPHHDAGAIRDTWGDIPVAGFFAQGELGPIAGRNFLHGFTASVAIFGAT